jgi:hypothetical protein
MCEIKQSLRVHINLFRKGELGMLSKSDDRWKQAINLLVVLMRAEQKSCRKPPISTVHEKDRMRLKPSECHCQAMWVRVTGRSSSTTVTVAWRDSTSGCYEDQVWRGVVARSPGVCAVSGRSIKPGDRVYRPRATHPTPVNAKAMILAEVAESEHYRADDDMAAPAQFR